MSNPCQVKSTFLVVTPKGIQFLCDYDMQAETEAALGKAPMNEASTAAARRVAGKLLTRQAGLVD